MLEDRDYMRQPDYHTSRVSWTVVLLMVNAAIFLVQLAANQLPGGKGIDIQNEYFALSLDGLRPRLRLATAHLPIHACGVDPYHFKFARHFLFWSVGGNRFRWQPFSWALSGQRHHRRPGANAFCPGTANFYPGTANFRHGRRWCFRRGRRADCRFCGHQLDRALHVVHLFHSQ